MTDVVDPEPLPRPREVSGKLVVVGMLLLGLAATATIFAYWDQHTKPFRSLTEAIGRTFKSSLPKVEGGRHKRGPMTLRIALRVPFDPDRQQTEVEAALDTLCQIVREHQDLGDYEQVEFYLIQMIPESSARKRQIILTPQAVQGRSSP